MTGRIGEITRTTKETDIYVKIDLDGNGAGDVNTGVGFLDHMLISFARHGLFDLTVRVKGDLHVDAHHTIEDTGIVLGQAVGRAVGDKRGIRRYGSCLLPHDESLVLCALDLSGRPYFVFDTKFQTEAVGQFPTEMVSDFFYAVCYSSMMNLHIKTLDGINAHHIIEAMFKAFAKALDQATMIDGRIPGLLSTKGSL